MRALALVLVLAAAGHAQAEPATRKPKQKRVVIAEVTDASDPVEGPAKAAPGEPPPPREPRDRTLNRLLSEEIVSEVGGYHRFEVLSYREVAQLLGVQRQRQLLGCDDTGCLAELAGALSADYLVSAQVAQLGERYRLDLRLVDMTRGKILATQGAFRPGKEALADAVPELMRQLFVEAGLLEPAPAAPAPPVELRAEPAPSRPALGWCFVPFGAGQFAEGHPVRGTLFAASEGAAFAVAGISLGLLEHSKTSGSFLQGGTFADPARARTQQAVYLAAFWTGVGLAVIGVGEALVSRDGP